ncbi:hypothetical protein QYM36_001519 [Artemia franciscana]|uniref:Eukaryotic translation initiation factor 5B n=2 Tax=Artemia franciscana TaxID=6661 RepID=A0AA88IAV5_ARTSF|nr:hypothetical protein QYM36_001519 [Artemia franciscana]
MTLIKWVTVGVSAVGVSFAAVSIVWAVREHSESRTGLSDSISDDAILTEKGTKTYVSISRAEEFTKVSENLFDAENQVVFQDSSEPSNAAMRSNSHLAATEKIAGGCVCASPEKKKITNDKVAGAGEDTTTAKKRKKKKKESTEEITKATEIFFDVKTSENQVVFQDPINTIEVEVGAKEVAGAGGDTTAAKKKKKKKSAVKEITGGEAYKHKKPNKLINALRKIKEEEEAFIKKEEEKLKIQKEIEKKEQEEKEKNEFQKFKKKEREKKKRLERKAKGLILTAKQKNKKERQTASIAVWKENGFQFPRSETKARPGTRVRPKKEKVEVTPFAEAKPEGVTEEAKVSGSTPEPLLMEKIAHNWEELLDRECEEPIVSVLVKEVEKPQINGRCEEGCAHLKRVPQKDLSSDSEPEEPNDIEKIKLRLENRSLDHLRAPVICVLGHVDTGKTKLLDKLRCTNVQKSEAGGITQQIGATNVPIDVLRELTKIVRPPKGSQPFKIKIPGLLIMDTPGHEHFRLMRSRGSSLCDLAILVVDIMHGVEPQTVESIKLLQDRGTPFIVALNKIDRLFEWQSNPQKDFWDLLKMQKDHTKVEFEQRLSSAKLQLSEQGLNTKMYYEYSDPKEYSWIVPTSAITGDGIANLIATVVKYNQEIQPEKITFSEELEATVLEVKQTIGHGITIDVILKNGSLKIGDTIVLPGSKGRPIVTQIRALLLPKPNRELRIKTEYAEPKNIKGCQGVKIVAKGLKSAISGSSFLVARCQNEIEILKDLSQEKEILGCIQCEKHGVYVQGSLLGSLEALLELLKQDKIPYSNVRLGNVIKSDVVKASIMLEHDPKFACILALDVEVERDAQEYADAEGVRIFKEDTVYRLFDSFKKHIQNHQKKKREEFKNIAVFPCMLSILPQHIYRKSNPIIVGVRVDAGVVKIGTPLCVKSKDSFIQIGIVADIQKNEKTIPIGKKGDEICLKIENVSDDAPKMMGHHFDADDIIMSSISRQSIDACKEHFRSELKNEDWKLIIKLKKIFGIL